MLLLTTTIGSQQAFSQAVTITLNPGWTWISYPRTDTLDVTTALQSIPPSEGDVIKTQNSYSEYINGSWYGSLQQLIPGKGLKYYSTKTEEVCFVFCDPNSLCATVTTTNVTNINQTSAKVSGNVIDEGGAVVIERGICWSKDHHSPTTDDNHNSSGSGIGSYTVTLGSLSNNRTYYARAYAINEYGTVYGNEVTFTTLISGVIEGKFTINAKGDQVYFSKGNLQYKPTTNTWRFAEHQYDYIGSANSNISSSYNGYIDLFGWGTSNYNHGANCYRPWSTSIVNSDYFAYGNIQYNLYDQTGKADWGYNSISSGGSQQNQWRTLTQSEWSYVISDRNTSSGILYAKAKVNGVNGLILLPDDWNPTNYPLNNTNTFTANYSSNTLNSSQWYGYQNHGAVFLPAAGYRSVTTVNSVDSAGYYWSASNCGDGAYGIIFGDNSLYTSYFNRSLGVAVRLVYLVHPVQYK